MLFQNFFSSGFTDLSDDQKKAMDALYDTRNLFITGGAGSGKSYLMRKFLTKMDGEIFPVLASTGAAAVLVGGRTFHSFFGLGIMEGGAAATIERATQNKRVMRRLKKLKGIVIDEVSMIPGTALDAAEQIARFARANSAPWGGIRIIAVGDFAQLPPVNRFNGQRDWAFLQDVWERTGFQTLILREMMRTKSDEFAKILNSVRVGRVSDSVRELLDSRAVKPSLELEGSYLFAKREDVQRVNLQKLAMLPGKMLSIETKFGGEERFIENLRNNAPVPPLLELKKNALVMLRQNDPIGRFVNGSLGTLKDFDDETLVIKLLTGGTVEVEKAKFSMLDAEGKEMAWAENFPVNLAYAITIHKAQGATLDKVIVNLQNLWEPGQAYVALSRVRSADDLLVDGWSPRSIIADPAVRAFHQRILDRLAAEAESQITDSQPA